MRVRAISLRNDFFDPAWVKQLAGKFAALYFQSLSTFEREPSPGVERAWKLAHELATSRRDYGGGLQLVNRAMWFLDEPLAGVGLKHYRGRVWWNAVAYLAAADEEAVGLVTERLNWESFQVAKQVCG